MSEPRHGEPGFHSRRKPKGHPRREARRQRAAARLAEFTTDVTAIRRETVTYAATSTVDFASLDDFFATLSDEAVP